MRGCNIKRIEKKFIDKFPRLVKCRITNCCIEIVEDYAFSDLKELYILDLSDNLLERIYKSYFSGQADRLKIILHNNPIKFIEKGFTDEFIEI